MSARSAQLFRIWFAAIAKFQKNPTLNYTTISIGSRTYFIAKKPLLKLIRLLIRKYRVVADDNKLIQQLYLNMQTDEMLKRLVDPEAAPILSEQLLKRFDDINRLPEEKQAVGQDRWVDEVEASPKTLEFLKAQDRESEAAREKQAEKPKEEKAKEVPKVEAVPSEAPQTEEKATAPKEPAQTSMAQVKTLTTATEPTIPSTPISAPPPAIIVPTLAPKQPEVFKETVLTTTPTPAKPSPSPSSILKAISPKQLHLPPEVSRLVKDTASKAQIGVRKLVGKYATPSNIVNIAPAVIGGGIGLLTGGGKGFLIGAGAGAATSVAIAGKGGQFITRSSLSAASSVGTTLQGFANIPGKIPGGLVKKGPAIIVAVAVAGVIIILSGPSSLFDTTAFFPPYQIAESAPLPPGGYTGGDIASCKFTRSDQSPKEASYNSPLLLSYTQEASRLSSVPAVVLAAFLRVESPTITTYSDNDIQSYSCAESTSGALGVMQIQPKDTKGYDGAAVDQGAKLIGKSADTLTREDYCDVKKNIIIGAGFILKKMSYAGFGDGSSWNSSWTNDPSAINALVTGYYGCLLYGGPHDCEGPYHYGQDVLTSIQSCKPTPTPGLAQLPGKLGDIVKWAGNINASLATGPYIDRTTGKQAYDRMVADITNGTYSAVKRLGITDSTGPDGLYWCTNLIIDAYNLAGVTGLNLSHQTVDEMLKFWESTSGYKYFDYASSNNPQSVISQIQPGDAMFFYTGNVGKHVSLISVKQIDSRGNGKIVTYDANSTHPGYEFPVYNWSIQNTFRNNGYFIRGFGGI